MATILHARASPIGEVSFSRRTAEAFLEAYRAAHPADTVRTVDVFDPALPAFGATEAAAKYKILHGRPHSAQEAAAWKAVEAAANDFKRADKYVLSAAMWNFGIPHALKKYIDVIVQPGCTFSFSPAQGYKGLVTGKPVMLIVARGGSYGKGSGAEAMDFQRPYLEAVLRFIGFTQIETLVVEPTLAAGPEAAAKTLAQAIAAAREKAGTF